MPNIIKEKIKRWKFYIVELYPTTTEGEKEAQQEIMNNYDEGYWSYNNGTKRLMFKDKEERANWIIINRKTKEEIGCIYKATRKELKRYEEAEKKVNEINLKTQERIKK